MRRPLLVSVETVCGVCGRTAVHTYVYGTPWIECRCGAWHRTEELVWEITLARHVFGRDLIFQFDEDRQDGTAIEVFGSDAAMTPPLVVLAA